jgi:hypothetical protein
LDNLTFDLDALNVLTNIGERALKQVFGRSVKIAQVDSERCGVPTERVAQVGVAFDASPDLPERPGVHGPHRRVPETTFGERPAERFARSGGAIDADDNGRDSVRPPSFTALLRHSSLLLPAGSELSGAGEPGGPVR